MSEYTSHRRLAKYSAWELKSRVSCIHDKKPRMKKQSGFLLQNSPKRLSYDESQTEIKELKTDALDAGFKDAVYHHRKKCIGSG